MDIEQFAQRMIKLLPQMHKGFSGQENNYLTRGKITFPQFWVLEYLLREGEGKMSDVATSLGVSKPAATGLVDRLIAQGLVTRRPDQKDRRIVWINISPKGKKIIQHIWQQKQQSMVRIFRQIPAADRAEHLRLTEQLLAVLNKLEVPAQAKRGTKAGEGA